jgi:hypothetical protein
MNEVLYTLLRGALTGVVSAAAVDFHAFRACKNYDEFVKYDWRTAAFRWVQGAVVGAVTSVSVEGIVGP